MPEIDLGIKRNFGMDSMDAPKKQYPSLHVDGKPAEMLDKQIEGATEMMAVVKLKVAKRTEVTENSEEEFDFEDGPIRYRLEIKGLTVVPDTRKGMPNMNDRQSQNFTRDGAKRMQQNEMEIDEGLDMISEGIKQMGS